MPFKVFLFLSFLLSLECEDDFILACITIKTRFKHFNELEEYQPNDQDQVAEIAAKGRTFPLLASHLWHS